MERKVPDTDPPPAQNPASGVGAGTADRNPGTLAVDVRKGISPIVPELPFPEDEEDEEAEEWAIRGQPGRPTQTREHLRFGPSRYRP